MTTATLIASSKTKAKPSDFEGYAVRLEPLAHKHFKKVAGTEYGAIRLRLVTPIDTPTTYHLIAVHGAGWDIYFWGYSFQADPMIQALESVPEEQAYLLLYHWFTCARALSINSKPKDTANAVASRALRHRKQFKCFFMGPTPRLALEALRHQDSQLPDRWRKLPTDFHLMAVTLEPSSDATVSGYDSDRRQHRAEQYAETLLESDEDWPIGRPIIAYIDLGHCYLFFSRYTPAPAVQADTALHILPS